MPPLDNKVVRQALNYAITRNRFTDSILLGNGNPESLPWRAGSPAFDDSRNYAYSFDLDKAKSLLESAGVSNLDLDILHGMVYSHHEDMLHTESWLQH